MNKNESNKTHSPNVSKNYRYNIFTFFPLVIFEQMRYFSNQFYVFLMLTQFFKPLNVGPVFDYIVPVSIVFLITFVKEAHDDFRRHKKDKDANNQIYS